MKDHGEDFQIKELTKSGKMLKTKVLIFWWYSEGGIRNACFEKYFGKFMSEGVFLLTTVHLVTLQRLLAAP